MPAGGTHIRLGGHRIDLRAGNSIDDFAVLLEGIARINLLALREDPRLREEAFRRVNSPPCGTRCYVSGDGSRNDCNCASGFQWTTDPEAQAMQGCPARDVWNDFRGLGMGHHESGRGKADPIAADCDCLAPIWAAVAAYSAWFPPDNISVAGIQLGAYKNNDFRVAIGITLPPSIPGKERIGHAYVLQNVIPPSPQPTIVMPYGGGPWWVADPSAHWGMPRPDNDFYSSGTFVARELLRGNIEGLREK